MNTVGLVLEGGGMRGVYTAGVLEFFAQNDVYFPYNIGVSAGACNAASYLSRQNGRNKVVTIDYVTDPRYLSWSNLIRRGEMFGMDFIFDEIPNKLVPFDFPRFHAATEDYVIGATDLQSGEPLYYSKKSEGQDFMTVLRASSSLPFIAPIVEYKGKKLMDGGISDPIPIRQSERDGNTRNILVLTRNKGYLKKPARFTWLLKQKYGMYPKFIEALLKRHEVYNDTMAYIEQREQNGQAFVIRPSQPLTVGRIERNPAKLLTLYQQGFEDARQQFAALEKWL